MSIDIATVRSLAHLAQIGIEDGDLQTWAQEFDTMLAAVEPLAAVNVEGVEPMTNPAHSLRLILVEDGVTDGNVQEDVLRGAPDAREGFYAVPKVRE
ncbi:MAG: Asp-tRNA(Asn)/Glu-tRNA(Gln) amidotransferase subunit GatC [Rubellimicrobium sp.]|nr:Asp-tRNA(Asn)/Glu-tRNA(Gln) amidotransferase subunit GatC [Rubellimicrobium sp.]